MEKQLTKKENEIVSKLKVRCPVCGRLMDTRRTNKKVDNRVWVRFYCHQHMCADIYADIRIWDEKVAYPIDFIEEIDEPKYMPFRISNEEQFKDIIENQKVVELKQTLKTISNFDRITIRDYNHREIVSKVHSDEIFEFKMLSDEILGSEVIRVLSPENDDIIYIDTAYEGKEEDYVD